jgi:hypothetical protein
MILDRAPTFEPKTSQPTGSQPLVMVVTDDPARVRPLEVVCDFLDIGIEYVSSELDVGYLMREFRPMAVVTEADLRGQDGFHVMQQVAVYHPQLPVMMVTGADPALMGAADAVREWCGLTNVRIEPALPRVGEMVDFLFRAGRQAGVSRMMPLAGR